jgi:membrane-bound lytic murein transglycosylase D
MKRVAAPAWLSGLLLCVCCILTSPAQAESLERDPFPAPAGLKNAVQFWRQVFGVWQRDQVVLHDDENLGVVYEVLDIPGEVGESLTADQKAYVKSRKSLLEARLRALETSVRNGVAVGGTEERLLNTIVRGAGRSALPGAAERVRSQRGMKERFLEGLRISGRYDALMRAEFKRRGLPEDLAYLPHVESSFVSEARSSAGAVGIWQFTPGAGRRFLRMDRAVDERYDPIFAARGAARYLDHAYDQLGDWALAITAYNHGVGGVMRAKDEWGADIDRIVHRYRGPLFGFASRNFYAEFLAVRSLVKGADKHFQEPIRLAAPLERGRVRVERPVSAQRLAALCGVETSDLADINPAWTSKAATGRVPLPAGTEVWIPSRVHPSQLLAYAEPVESAIEGTAPSSVHGRILTARLDTGDWEDLWSSAHRLGTARAEDGLVRVAYRHPGARKHAIARTAHPKRVATHHKKSGSHASHKRGKRHPSVRREAASRSSLVAANDLARPAIESRAEGAPPAKGR